jgi:hypothetical protein
MSAKVWVTHQATCPFCAKCGKARHARHGEADGVELRAGHVALRVHPRQLEDAVRVASQHRAAGVGEVPGDDPVVGAAAGGVRRRGLQQRRRGGGEVREAARQRCVSRRPA